MVTRYCPQCSKTVEVKETWQDFGGNKHIRGCCSNCGKWLLWVPHAESVIAREEDDSIVHIKVHHDRSATFKHDRIDEILLGQKKIISLLEKIVTSIKLK